MIFSFPALEFLSQSEKDDLDFIDLADGDFTGTDSAVTDRINISDLELDDDEIMIISKAEVIRKDPDTEPFSVTNDTGAYHSVQLTLFEPTTALDPVPEDILFYNYRDY